MVKPCHKDEIDDKNIYMTTKNWMNFTYVMTLWTKKKYHHINDTIEVYDKMQYYHP